MTPTKVFLTILATALVLGFFYVLTLFSPRGVYDSRQDVEISLADALEMKTEAGKLYNEFLEKLQDSKIAKYLKVFSNEECAPHIVSMAFIGIKGEVLMNALQKDAVLVSTGSACSSKKAGNRTLEAMGVKKEDIVGSVRVSFSPYMEYDIDFVVDAFVKHVERFESNNIVIKG